MFRRVHLFVLAGVLALASASTLSGQAADPKTEITKWQDGKAAAVAITYDDSTINQFRIALPLMSERGLVGTFFVITGQIPGSKNLPTFVGRPIMDILKESATVPTNKDNVYERTSMISYLAEIQRIPDPGVLDATNPGRIQSYNPLNAIKQGNFKGIDDTLAKLRATGKIYKVGAIPYIPVRSEEQGRPRGDSPGGLTWDEMRKVAAQGHEIANHSVSHRHLPVFDAANTLYEVEKAKEDLKQQMGEESLFSIEVPYGIDDDRVRQVVIDKFPLTRNWVNDPDGEFMDGIMRGDNRDPAKTSKPYMEWERGPVTATTVDEMKGWVDTSLNNGTWLVLVIHGIDGVGSSPLLSDRLRQYFDYMKAKSDTLWIATYRDGAKYIRERMKSQIASKRSGDAIEVAVTHPLDKKVYSLPLTARTVVPAGWTTVKVTQGKDTKEAAVQHEGGESFVQYRIMPNAGAARLEKK
jgi:peptidoglycan/xylan/chitin deacetylase (PgdA/CDA1 family)